MRQFSNIVEIKSKIVLNFFEHQETSKYLKNINKTGVNALFQFGESALPGYYSSIIGMSRDIEYDSLKIYKLEMCELLADESFFSENINIWPELIIFAVLAKDLLEAMELEYFSK
jgi:hypothetical protein